MMWHGIYIVYSTPYATSCLPCRFQNLAALFSDYFVLPWPSASVFAALIIAELFILIHYLAEGQPAEWRHHIALCRDNFFQKQTCWPWIKKAFLRRRIGLHVIDSSCFVLFFFLSSFILLAMFKVVFNVPLCDWQSNGKLFTIHVPF